METETNKESEKEVNIPSYWDPNHNRAGRIMGGLVIVAIGGLFLAKQLGVFFPPWVFTWQMLIIVIGFYIGARHSFRGGGWLIPIAIGAVFLLDQFYPAMQMKQYIWPVIIILAGLLMIFNSRANHWRHHWERKHWKHMKGREGWKSWKHNYSSTIGSTEEYLDSVSVFGGIKKNIISKNFKGGDVVTVFGGTEIDLSQADIQGRVVLELTQVFGGTSLIVPPNWQIDSQMVAFLGGIEDKRNMQTGVTPDPNKVLVLQGNSVFGGIEIKSY